MYTAFYGLREKPFALSPDPRYLYLAGSHREALAHLLYGIEQGEGFISVTGEVGTGKTTLCRTLLERLDGDTELAFLFNPSRTALELLQSICAEFDLPAEGLARRTLMAQLDHFLVEQKRLGRRVLLIIDEAQTLSENTLEQVRLLSNLETSRDKLIQILMLGQPELDRKLDGQGLRQLRQRISVRWKLEPLSAEETRSYVRHRVAIAAGQPKELFSEAALRQIHRRTGGIPRLINQLCDRALLAGYAARKAEINISLIRAAAREIPDARIDREGELSRGAWMRPWLVVVASFVIVTLATFAGLQVGRHGLANASRSLLAGSDLFGTGQEEDRRLLAEKGLSGASDSRSETMRRLDSARDLNAATPRVAANAPSGLTNTMSADGGLAAEKNPPLARMIGYLPEPSGKKLERTPDGKPGPSADSSSRAVASEKTPGFVSAAVALPIPPLRPEVTALAPGLLPSLLRKRDGRIAMAESQLAILEAFGRRVPSLLANPTNTEELRKGIEERGLATTSFDGGSIDLLRRLDHPVLLPLAAVKATIPVQSSNSLAATPSPGAAESRWLAVVGFVGDRARLAGLISGRIVTVPVVELTDHWLEMGIIVWERFEPVPEMLLVGEEGRGVLWLQRSLAELRYFRGDANGSFDDDTRNALIRFQRRQGLVADGIAGPLTQIALYGKLTDYPVPRLSKAGATRATAALPEGPSTPSARAPGAAKPSRSQASGDSG
jgi:general secretion pathway protein A